MDDGILTKFGEMMSSLAEFILDIGMHFLGETPFSIYCLTFKRGDNVKLVPNIWISS